MKKYIIPLIILVVIIGLFVLGNNSQKSNLVYFENTEVACLTDGHARLAEHIHPRLKIIVDGKEEDIPANIGIKPGCMSEIHTHDGTGELHVESFLAGRIKDFNLGHFFSVWSKDHIRDGYDIEIIQDGKVKNSIKDVKFIDNSNIEIKYTSSGTTESKVSSDKIINLSNQGLDSIPSSVFDKTNIEELNVSNNSLTGSIQSQIQQLTKLKVLNASNNLMTGVPAEIGQLKNLEILNLSNNELTGLPNELSNLSNLKVLNLSGNDYSEQDLNIIKTGLSTNVEIIID